MIAGDADHHRVRRPLVDGQFGRERQAKTRGLRQDHELHVGPGLNFAAAGDDRDPPLAARGVVGREMKRALRCVAGEGDVRKVDVLQVAGQAKSDGAGQLRPEDERAEASAAPLVQADFVRHG